MNCEKARKIVKLLGVLLLFACVWLGDVRNVSAAGEITFLAPEGEEEPQVLEEIFVTETIKPMNASSVSGKWGALNWSLNNGVLKITGSGAMEVLDGNYPWKAHTSEVTEVIIGDYVTMTAKQAFEGMSNIKSVTLGSRLDYIAPCTFKYCTALEKIVIPARVTGIDYETFYYCSALKEIVFAENSMLQGIGYNAFVYCTELTSITLPEGVEVLGSGVFWHCWNLETVKLSNKVNGIYPNAFSNCRKLKSLSIPESVAFIQYNAFDSCEEMTSIEIEAKLESIENQTFVRCLKLEKVVLPEGIKKINQKAFADCVSLTSVNIPEGVQEIGARAFDECESLKKITIPSTVATMGHHVFSDCDSLEEIIIPATVTVMGNGMLSDCNSLQKATVYAKCDIPNYMFSGCTSLSEVILGDEITGIGERAFENCVKLNTIVIPSSVKSIGDRAFLSCEELTTFKCYSMDVDYGNNAAFVFTYAPVTLYGLVDSTTQIFAESHRRSFIPITQLDTPISKKIINVVNGPHIYWNEVTEADYYTIYRADSRNGVYKKLAEKLSVPHYIDTSAVSGKTYFYKLEAGNPHLSSELSLPLGIAFVGTPDITSRVNNAAGIKLGWNKINGATGYAIYRKSYAENDAWKRVATISGNSTFTWTDEAVKANNGSVYKYTVRALAGSDKKTLSGCRTTGRTMVRLTSRVLNSAEKIGSTSIKCTWTTSSAITGYEVRFMVGDSVIKTVTIGNYKTGVKTFTGLAKGKKYKVQVRSYKKVDGVGSFYSAWSVAKYVQL